MIDFSGVNLPFNVSELLSSASSLLGIVGQLVLLGLAIHFQPLMLGLIFKAFGRDRDYKHKLVEQRKHNRGKYFG